MKSKIQTAPVDTVPFVTVPITVMRTLETVPIKVNTYPNQKDFGKSFMLGSSLDDETYPLKITGNALQHDNYEEFVGQDNKTSIRPEANSREVDKEGGDEAL